MAASAAPPVAPDAMVQEGQIHSPTGTFLSPMQPRWNTSCKRGSHARAGAVACTSKADPLVFRHVIVSTT
eukprot:1159850-Pelagomonas_calceolata.AAC.1